MSDIASDMRLSKEQHRLLASCNDTNVEFPRDKCIHQLFEERAQYMPDVSAVVSEGSALTYAQLNARANQLAHYLQNRGIGPEVLVGICLERSLNMVVALMAILKAGGAYVPLDPGGLSTGAPYPRERLAFMLNDTGVAMLLTETKIAENLPENRVPVLCLDADGQVIAQESTENLTSRVHSENLAYVIYTSGSTGRPKGVMIQHRSVVNLATALYRNIYFHHPACPLRVSLNAPLGFDASVQQLVQLFQGHALYIVPDEIRADGKALLDFLERTELDVLDCTPSQLRLLLDAGLLTGSGAVLKLVLVGGEAIDEITWRALAQSQATKFFNVYGPTECTVDSTFCLIKPDLATPTIGGPMTNTHIYLLDSELRPVPMGEVGELYIGGAGVGRGYWNRPELTAEKFIPNPFRNEPGAHLYKTGDLGRYLADGNIEFLGRMDSQVKIRGHRIELGEIEAILGEHPRVREAVVLAREDVPGNKRLSAYIVPAPECQPTIGELRNFLKEKLPDYMVPSSFMTLERLPLTANGKVDRHALPAPGQDRPDLERTLVVPRTDLEEQLVALWEELLEIRPVGVNENFFDLGGHSVLAVRMVTEVEKRLHKNLTLANLFQAPTVTQLADILNHQQSRLTSKALVALQPRGCKPPFFAGGSHPNYALLGKHLGNDQPVYKLDVYALQEERLNTGRAPFSRIEDMAAHFLKDIRTVQPQGPYFLGGGCEGGQVAFEIARQLQLQGQQIGLLLLWESPALVLKPFLRKLVRRIKSIRQRGPRDLVRSIYNKMTRTNWRSEDGENALAQRHRRINDAIFEAMDNYAPSTYLGNVILFRASQPLPDEDDAVIGWDKLVKGEIEVHVVPGNHFTFLKNDIVTFVERLRTCLGKAQAACRFPVHS